VSSKKELHEGLEDGAKRSRKGGERRLSFPSTVVEGKPKKNALTPGKGRKSTAKDASLKT